LNQLIQQGISSYQEHDYEKAIVYIEQARKMLAELYGKENEEYATLTGFLGGLHLHKANYEKAQTFLEEAKALTEKLNGKQNLHYAQMCLGLSLIYKVKARYLESENLLKEVLAIQARFLGKQHRDYATSLRNLAILYNELGRYAEAEALILEAKQIVAEVSGKEDADYAVLCNLLGSLYSEKENYPKAELFLKEALAIQERVVGNKHPDYLISLKNLASLYKKQGNYANLIPLYETILTVEQSLLGDDHPNYAITCNNLADLYERMFNYEKAELLYKKAHDIILDKLGENHPSYSDVCNNLGGLYLEWQQYEKAEYFYKKSLTIRANVLGEFHFSYTQSCNNLGLLYLKQGKYEEAEPLFLKSRDILLKTFGKKHSAYANYCNNLGTLYFSKGDSAKGIGFYKEASATYVHHIQSNFVGLSEKEKEQYLATFRYVFEVYFSFASSFSDPSVNEWLFENNLITRGLLFFSTSQLRRALEKSKKSLLQESYRQWIALRKQLALAYQKTEQTVQDSIETLEKQVNEIEKKLSQQLEKEGIRVALTPTKRSWKEIQQKLRPQEALIELTRVRYYEKGWTDSVFYVALVIRKDSKYPEKIILPEGSKLEKESIAYYRNMIRFKLQDKQSYYAFFQPFKEVLKGISKVYFSADGVYHQINLATLYNPQTQNYLVDELSIQLISTARDFLEMNTKAKKNYRNLYLMGYPDFSGKTTSVEEESENYEEELLVSRIAENQRFFDSELGTISVLPATKIEVQQIEAIAKKTIVQTKVFLSSEASEENLKSVRSPDILHIATHGFFIPEKQEIPENKRNYDNPLLRSGLLLAGAELAFKKQSIPTQENGILTAQEAINLSLEETELVVLSACETGLGEIKNGEGVFGLQRALQEAGAKSVLMSLWKVDDTATQEMMGLFYENMLLKKQDKRTAFAAAQAAMRTKYKEPYYWGAFVMVGQ
ncbi:MAG: CHAT domain-containing protein, partial [Flammeovirgaceae bacterium]|nr:CHAT domain-containing protein [Flammeovirgaceae bacterium]MDW8287473.1 CHAT domain-containing tetratricopeptide repeat protein [Flammeovirgaceae bacterium]